MKKVTDPLIKRKDKQNVDILGNLFKGSAGDSSTGLEELSELTYRKRPSAGIIAKSENGEGFLQINKGKTQPKRKISYSISKSKVSEGGAPKVKIKIVVPNEIKHHVSMSRVVDYALKSFLKELKSAAEE